MPRSRRWSKADVASRGIPKASGRSQKRLIAPQPLERDILKLCLTYLNAHPNVAFAFRANTGMVPIEGGKRMFRAGFTGCSDILGMLKGGRLLAVEVKRPGKNPTAAQQSFLDRVNQEGGLAFVARGLQDCVVPLIVR